MKLQTILFEENAEGIASIILNRPQAKNTINIRMVDELTEVFQFLDDTSKARAVVLQGSANLFSEGIDFMDFPPDRNPDIHGFSRWERMIRAIERIPMITLAAIDGACLGGGLHMILACDVRIATSRSVFQLHEAQMGFIPGMSTFRLSKFIGLGRARRMALTGRCVSADEALSIGLTDKVCENDSLTLGIQESLDEFCCYHKDAHELIRRLLDESYETSYENFIGGFLAAQHRTLQTEAFRDRIKKIHTDKAHD